jgi:hypothetical protein
VASAQRKQINSGDDPAFPPVDWVTREEGNRQFDELARERLGMNGAEFLRRLDSGEFESLPDDDEHRAYVELAILSAFGR